MKTFDETKLSDRILMLMHATPQKVWSPSAVWRMLEDPKAREALRYLAQSGKIIKVADGEYRCP